MIRDFIHVDDGFSVDDTVRKVIVKQDDCPTSVPKIPLLSQKIPKNPSFYAGVPAVERHFLRILPVGEPKFVVIVGKNWTGLT